MNMVRKFTTELSEPHQVRLTEALKKLDGSRVLLTGGTGFVGKWLIETAKFASDVGTANFEIVVPTRDLSSSHAESTREIGFKNLSLIEGDLLTDTLDIGEVDAIIHAATPASAALNDSDPGEMTRINTQSMQSALKYAKNAMPFLFTSSGAIYGNQPQTVAHISEKQPRPFSELTSAYAKGKQIAESMCIDAAKNKTCKAIIARLFTFSGKHLPRNTHFAIGNFVQNVLDRKSIVINSDGLPRRSYLYGADMATWLWCALTTEQSHYSMHIGSEHSTSILELAKTVARVSASELSFAPKIKIAATSTNPNFFHQYVPANDVTRSHLRVEEWTNLETQIAQMIRASLN